MSNICLYFEVHQPYRVRNYTAFDNDLNYFDDRLNKEIVHKVASNCYLPSNDLFLKLLKTYPGFKINFSFSGIVIDQFREYYPEVLESFKKLINTNQTEVLAETYYHSLAFLYSIDEFKYQIQKHSNLMKEIFNYAPKVFRNTELIYNNEIGRMAKDMGFIGIITQAVDTILKNRSPNYLYKHPTKEIKILLRNYKLSDDIAFRFPSKNWADYPLTAKKFAKWISQFGQNQIVNLCMDYETFGEHQSKTDGIFDFLEQLPNEIFKVKGSFKSASDVIEKFNCVDEINIPNYITWANIDADIDTWIGNEMQKKAIKNLYSFENEIKKLGNQEIDHMWRKLQTSDHFYYMSTRHGDLRTLYSPHGSPYNAFISYMFVLNNLKNKLKLIV